jgi:phosphoacetylglucosamine mutase
LKQAVVDGAHLLYAEIADFGLLTTPQLHYLIHEMNTFPSFSIPSSDLYCNIFSETFINVMVGSSDKTIE